MRKIYIYIYYGGMTGFLQSLTYWQGISELKGHSEIQRASNFIISVTMRLVRAELAPTHPIRAVLGTHCCMFCTSLKVIWRCH